MRSVKTVHVVSVHAEGEVGDLIVGGVPIPPGDTLWEQSRYIANDNTLRQFVLNEPRGGVFRHVNLLVPPKDPKAAIGFIIMEPEDTPPMSGSNSICVATAVLETGIVPMVEPETRFIMEAPGGLVNVVAQCKDGKATEIRVHNLPSFAGSLDVALEVPGMGTLIVDTAYGGDSFTIVDAHALGFTLDPSEARDLAVAGITITKAANEQLKFVHPTNPDWTHFSFCQLALPIFKEQGQLISHNAVAIQPGKIDRSPTGTGVSARMAVLHAKGIMKVGDTLRGRSIIGSHFNGRIENEISIGDKMGITPSIAGQAWLTGTHQHMLDPTDPWPNGYIVSDTWPRIGKD
ncbi:MAG: hypothetical protein F2839_02130 [Actinobacteria bacterium]|uniref:Unannotated protein n=1 Tax=freshwater metagenome TaxID=449393 RepID=A0A6J5YY50_9ZZZZ|nr:hypothetical protein [Actinomycetota bacterium]